MLNLFVVLFVFLVFLFVFFYIDAVWMLLSIWICQLDVLPLVQRSQGCSAYSSTYMLGIALGELKFLVLIVKQQNVFRDEEL